MWASSASASKFDLGGAGFVVAMTDATGELPAFFLLGVKVKSSINGPKKLIARGTPAWVRVSPYDAYSVKSTH